MNKTKQFQSFVTKVLGKQYVKGFEYKTTDLYLHITIHYDSVIFPDELEKIDIYLGAEWSNISHHNSYNQIEYLLPLPLKNIGRKP
jgi:hypothetical protein